MKKLNFFICIVISFFIYSCGGNDSSDNSADKNNSDSIKKVSDSLTRAKLKEQETTDSIKSAEFIKNLKAGSLTVKTSDVTISFLSFASSATWYHDNYPGHVIYNTAERGKTYFTVSVSIDAGKNTNPNLPPIYLYKIVDKKLKYVGSLRYEYTWWNDYGDYLGNYHVSYAEFEHTQIIKFTCGLEIDEDLLNEPFCVIVGYNCNQERQYDRFSNPPYSYTGSITSKTASELTYDNFDSNYNIVKIYNENKIK